MAFAYIKRLAKALVLGWAILFFLNILLATLIDTGPYALSGPKTTKDDIKAGLWLYLSIFQLALAMLANKRDKPWLFWVTAAFVVLTMSMVVVPLLTRLFLK